MAQRYTSPVAHERMAKRMCPECGEPPEAHSTERRFWMRDPLSCSLRPDGVTDRINQYRLDHKEPSS